MIKWAYYAKDILRVMSGVPFEEISIELSQALLQHYGWRSFYIDVTLNPVVAAWFASHKYISRKIFEVCDDCFDKPVLLVHEAPQYKETNQEGHIYAISKSKALALGLSLHDLTKINITDFEARFIKQDALLLGPVRNLLPEEAIVAHITLPTKVLKSITNNSDYSSTESLFPTRDKDSFLKSFLSIPYQLINPHDNPIVYQRGLPLPEYDFNAIEKHPQNEAFYTEFWIADHRGDNHVPLNNALFLRVPEEMFYVTPQTGDCILPQLTRLLRKHSEVIIETSGILRFPEFQESYQYGKGIVLLLVDPNIVEVSSLELDHPGSVVTGVSAAKPWSYEISKNHLWKRINREEDCPCNNDLRHLHHIWFIKVIDDFIRRNDFIQMDELNYMFKPK